MPKPKPPVQPRLPLSGPLEELVPRHLAERGRALGPAPLRPERDFVLCWLRATARAEENPALDFALALGRHLGRPVFVYLGLSERTPYASDRLHTFQLQATRELLLRLRARGVGAAFHLERPGHRERVLPMLVAQAAALVLDEQPLEPLRGWAERLGAASDAAVFSVDAACVVPLNLIGRAYTRAFAFRDATAGERRARVPQPWVDEPATGPAFVPVLPFAPVPLEELDDRGLARLVASCEIDHSVPPVRDTRGGSAAGYARWDAFRARGLRSYARDRNDPLLAGVSRMSPYLHFGCVSPLRLAREADAEGGAGAEKFLDELLIWRELAWAFCRFTERPETVDALPGWARETLALHAGDPRPALTWEELSRARSGDPLWDACQRSLLRHGELHNNLRMTWGKALLGWTPGAERALALLCDLNHRYALDGRDPASLGGILWCLGQFDRPFAPEVPVLGSVRPRPLSWHAGRLDLPALQLQVARPARPQPRRVAVVGAGIAGLACARVLSDQGANVVVFDKGRGPGGRAATRRAEGFVFDHGAQFFTARDPGFLRHLASWQERGLVEAWEPREVEHAALPDGSLQVKFVSHQHPRYVAQPGMAALGKHLAEGLDLRLGSKVLSVRRDGAGHLLQVERGEATQEEGPFDALVVAVPAAQAVPLLDAAPALAARAAAARLAPCWALLAGFDAPLPVPFDAASLTGSPLSWIARSASKPGRGPAEAWVAHASAGWSEKHLEQDPAEVSALLLAAFSAAVQIAMPAPRLLQAHRWRYALASTPLPERCLFEPALGLGACGDWCGGARLESAWLSGVALAGRLLGESAPAPLER